MKLKRSSLTEQKMQLIVLIRRYEDAYANSVKLVRAKIRNESVITFDSPMLDVIQFYRDKLKVLRKELEALDAAKLV
jgi:hypothetical protein